MSSNPPSPSDSAALQRSLDVLARRGAQRIRQWRLRQATRDAFAWSPLALAATPLGALAAQLAGSLAGGATTPLSMGALAIASVIGALAVVGVLVIWDAIRFRPSRAAALALHDANNGTRERLVTADEFIATDSPVGDATEAAFKRAAVSDATSHAQRALDTPLPPISSSPRPFVRRAWWGVPAALALMVAVQFAAFSFHPANARENAGRSPELADATQENRETTERKLARRPAIPPVAVAPEIPASEGSQSRSTKRLPRQEESLDGEQGSGSGSRSSSANAATPAAGMSPQRKNPPAPKKNETTEADADAEEKQKRSRPKPKRQKSAELAADADSGKGQASSSSSSASPFEMPEQPDKTGQMLKGETEDESEEDEDEQENSNAASKPMTNQRDPAVDRNLSTRPPGTGDQPANGRGGPGGLKKSRGVPSMILGIPVPDRVPGTINPGRSKVTQEFTRPKEESHARIDALTHAERAGMIGHLEQPELFPWRRTLIENYFLSIREAAVKAPPTPPTDAEQ